jgi:hypothetical protein
LTIAPGLACEHLWTSGHCPYEKGVEMHIAVLGNAGAANGATKLAFGAIFDWPLGQYAGLRCNPRVAAGAAHNVRKRIVR